MVKAYVLMCHILLGVNCVATEVRLRFSVRSFGCVLFYLGECGYEIRNEEHS